ncbi:MAG TPA: FtsX-like permease family protein [Planctomycetota bacterium]|nr:FtsX-like permease family protein [Planctomycetota bacterium]
MSLWSMVLRSLAQRRLGAGLTAFGVALGVMLVVTVLALYSQITAYYDAQGASYPMVIGAEGYDLQLVQNVVYHTDRSPGLMKYGRYDALRKEPWVRLAVPYAVGDAFRGYRVVGTTDGIFNPAFQPRKGAPLEIASGRPFVHDPAALQGMIELVERGGSGPPEARPKIAFEATVGAEVAERLGLKIGDRIEPTHGVEGGKAHEHVQLWDVTGVLKRTGTAIDRVVFINLESFYGIEDHLVGGRLPTGEAGLSAVLVWPKGPMELVIRTPRLDAEEGIQAVRPAEVIRTKLYDQHLKPAQQTLLWVTLFNVLTGVVGVAVALYNTMNERRREIAVLRAVGARRSFILRLLVGEAAMIAAIGAAVGLLLARVLLYALATGAADFGLFGRGLAFDADPWGATWVDVFVLEGDDADRTVRLPADALAFVGAVLVGAVAGLLPALKGYRTPVAENLAPTS